MKTQIFEPMDIQQYADILKHVQKYHQFGGIGEDGKMGGPKGKSIKYIDNCWDTRISRVHMVGFRGFGNDIVFRTNSLCPVPAGVEEVPYVNLFDWVMDYLNDKWVPSYQMEKHLSR